MQRINKKGVAGMNLAKGFVVGVLTIAVLLLLIMIVMNSFGTTDTITDSVINESGRINATGYMLGNSGFSGFSSPVITAAYNNTDSTIISLENITISSAGNVTNATSYNWNDALISYTYKYTNISSKGEVINYVNVGILNLAAQFPTLFTILGVVMLVLLIIVIIVVMNKLGGRENDYSA